MPYTEPQKLLDSTAKQLGEHFDSVLILASNSESDDDSHYTDGISAGTGNWYARNGMAVMYLEKNKAVARQRAIDQDSAI